MVCCWSLPQCAVWKPHSRRTARHHGHVVPRSSPGLSSVHCTADIVSTIQLTQNTDRHDEQCYLAQCLHVCISESCLTGSLGCTNFTRWFLCYGLRCSVTRCSHFVGTCRYNKYTQIAARALRASLKEEERVAAEKRGLTVLRYQHWEKGQGGPQVRPQSSNIPEKFH